MARRPPEILFRLALFVLPFALAFLYVVSLLAVMSLAEWQIVFGGMVAYLVAPVGTEVVIPGVFVLLFGANAPVYVFVFASASVVLVDVFTALFFLWNWDLVERVPHLGRLVGRVEQKCRQVIEKRRWGERATYLALAGYVALPFQMTGGLFGSVLGRVMGLDKVKVFVAVAAGPIVSPANGDDLKHRGGNHERVRSGLTAAVKIASAEKRDVLAIPVYAITRADNKMYVDKLNDKDIERVEITTGITGSDGFVEILQGLNEGDSIVVNGQE